MAEVIFASMVDDIEVLSAGISTLRGDKAAENAIKICEFNGLDLKNHESKNFDDLKIEDDDLILTLTCGIRDTLISEYPNLEIYTMKEYAGEDEYLDINDPIGGDLLIYNMCFQEINETLEEIVEMHPDRFEVSK
jgi:protein-tyrosine phosphatase